MRRIESLETTSAKRADQNCIHWGSQTLSALCDDRQTPHQHPPIKTPSPMRVFCSSIATVKPDPSASRGEYDVFIGILGDNSSVWRRNTAPRF